MRSPTSCRSALPTIQPKVTLTRGFEDAVILVCPRASILLVKVSGWKPLATCIEASEPREEVAESEQTRRISGPFLNLASGHHRAGVHPNQYGKDPPGFDPTSQAGVDAARVARTRRRT